MLDFEIPSSTLKWFAIFNFGNSFRLFAVFYHRLYEVGGIPRFNLFDVFKKRAPKFNFYFSLFKTSSLDTFGVSRAA